MVGSNRSRVDARRRTERLQRYATGSRRSTSVRAHLDQSTVSWPDSPLPAARAPPARSPTLGPRRWTPSSGIRRPPAPVPGAAFPRSTSGSCSRRSCCWRWSCAWSPSTRACTSTTPTPGSSPASPPVGLSAPARGHREHAAALVSAAHPVADRPRLLAAAARRAGRNRPDPRARPRAAPRARGSSGAAGRARRRGGPVSDHRFRSRARVHARGPRPARDRVGDAAPARADHPALGADASCWPARGRLHRVRAAIFIVALVIAAAAHRGRRARGASPRSGPRAGHAARRGSPRSCGPRIRTGSPSCTRCSPRRRRAGLRNAAVVLAAGENGGTTSSAGRWLEFVLMLALAGCSAPGSCAAPGRACLSAGGLRSPCWPSPARSP